MPAFTYLYASETTASVRAKIVGYAQAAGLRISNWIVGGVGLQILETIAPTVATYTAQAAQAIRGFASLDTSTDPGDPDPYDATNAGLDPEPGYLSDFGSNVFGTDRIGEDFAVGTVTFTNAGAGAVSQTFAPDALTFQRDYADATGLAPTYRNTDGGPTYQLVGGGTLAANGDGTLTVGVGLGVFLPIQCEQGGTAGSATATHISILVNSLPGVTVSNLNAVLGSDRESADPYRARCRIAPASVSPNGPADAYRYIALGAERDALGNVFYFPVGTSNTGLGADASGNLVSLPNASGTSLGVTRVYASKDSATGDVILYFANSSGPAAGGDVTDLTALFNAAYWPDATTRSFNAAISHSVTVDGTVKAKAGAGVSAASVAAKIATALTAYFATVDIGGYDQTAGAGTLYLDEIRAVVSRADPSIYHVVLSSPGADIALALGEVATLTNNIGAGDVTIS